MEANGDPLAGGTCGVEARATFSGLPQLSVINSTTVVTLTALQLYVADGTLAAAPSLDSTSLTGLTSPDTTIRLFKCDFSHYSPVRLWVVPLRPTIPNVEP